MVRAGILDFRYGHSVGFAKRFRRTGSYSINLGDCIQSLAVRGLVEGLGVPSADIVRVDRDSLPSYQGPRVRLITNGCFHEQCFPLPAHVEPVFIGFQTASRKLIQENLGFFKQHQPIGCRDTNTRDLFREQGVDAYITGCLTMTLPHRGSAPSVPKPYFIGGEGPGEMPPGLKKHVPADILKSAVHINQREEVRTFPLSDADALAADRLAEELLESYRREATLVVTPLLHAAGPCLAMGIPVILARKNLIDRFTAINRLLPVYTPDDFPVIDWQPAACELEELKACLSTLVARALAGEGGPTTEERQTLASFYDKEPYLTQDLIAARSEREARPFWKKLLPFRR